MIEIPEEKLLEDITDLLMNELPKVLLEIEEQSDDGRHLPPFRYVGSPEKLPPGSGLPHAFLDFEDASLTEKDRIIKNVIYSMKITIKLAELDLIWCYFACLEKVLYQKKINTYRIQVINKSRTGNFLIKVKYSNKIG
ncbi:hypothetical protein K7J14_02625 [Treponema zuelzerae]|uniref:Uncharacterized protein n=1 Tax=Teretinema zuelzerae TaxID=156 RepID=A0AAE3JHY6_9SPIR|nr:hypothetical protein [Teretinema zuelzerae]MCD1653593.1 hypothetical protein [Teretinema zuelzerae]